MRLGLLAEKVGMSRFFDENRTNHCVTLLKVNDCKVIAVKDKEKHGYSAVTLGLGKNSKKVNKPFKSFLKTARSEIVGPITTSTSDSASTS